MHSLHTLTKESNQYQVPSKKISSSLFINRITINYWWKCVWGTYMSFYAVWILFERFLLWRHSLHYHNANILQEIALNKIRLPSLASEFLLFAPHNFTKSSIFLNSSKMFFLFLKNFENFPTLTYLQKKTFLNTRLVTKIICSRLLSFLRLN